jgi:hypothetical protein
VIIEHESNSDSYDGEVEDISLYEASSDSSMTEVKIQIQIVLLTCKFDMGGNDTFRFSIQHKTLKQSPR